MRILLTGFQPFGDLQVNPSQSIVEHFLAQKRDDLIALVLPTEYAAAGEQIAEAIRTYHPDAVIALGVAQGRTTISLERVAINVDQSSRADNAGVTANGERIIADGAAAYWSTLPLQAIESALEAREIPVSISNHAGTYICNHAFYVARHTLEQLASPIPCGFIHVPDLLKPDAETPQGLPLEVMIAAVEVCLQTVGEYVLQAHPSLAG